MNLMMAFSYLVNPRPAARGRDFSSSSGIFSPPRPPKFCKSVMTLIAPRLLRLLFAGVGGGPKGRKHLIASYSMTDGTAAQDSVKLFTSLQQHAVAKVFFFTRNSTVNTV